MKLRKKVRKDYFLDVYMFRVHYDEICSLRLFCAIFPLSILPQLYRFCTWFYFLSIWEKVPEVIHFIFNNIIVKCLCQIYEVL